MSTITWVDVCAANDIEEEDVYRFDRGRETYALYRTADGVFATEGWCTHEQAHLADGLVIDDIIECPLHQGRFHIPSGKAKSPPVCIDLKTFPAREEGGRIQIGLPG